MRPPALRLSAGRGVGVEGRLCETDEQLPAMSEKLYDVLIVEVSTGIVESIAGENMRRSTGHYNALRRVETVIPRINDRFFVDLFAAGKFKKGDCVWKTPGNPRTELNRGKS